MGCSFALMKLPAFILCGLFFVPKIFGAELVNERDTTAIMLNEISVSAVKQSTGAELLPEAATVLTQKELEQTGTVSIRGISDVVPNFYMPDYGSRITSTIYVRGIGARMDNPSVGLNVDNVPYLNKDAYDFDVADISWVEMLRGPQSTLYGRNTMAGVINVRTLSPMNFQGLRVFAEGGNGGRLRAAVGWYDKLSAKTALSATFEWSHLKGFFTNEYNGKHIDKENNFGARIKFQWHPSSVFHIENTAAAGFLRQGGYPYEFIDSGKINYNDTCFYRRFTFTDGLSLSYSGDKFRLVSITSVQHIDDNMTLDQDFLPLDYFTLTQKKKETSFTEELVIKGSELDDRYKWLCGVFGFYKHMNMYAPVTFKNVGIRELIESHRNDANPYYPIEWDTRMFVLNSDFTIPTYGLAAYHESIFSTGKWSFTAGIRVDYESSRMNYHSYCNTGYKVMQATDEGLIPYRDVPIVIDDTGKIKRDFVTVLPKISALYDFDNDLGNVYLKFSRGYKAGGFNTQMFSDVLQQRLMALMGIGSQYKVEDIVSYKPEQSWNYELGSHLNLLGGKLNTEMVLFYIDCRDQQLTMFPDGTTTGRIMTNAGKTRSYGAELTVNYKLNKNINLNGSYGYTHATFKEFFNGIKDFKGKYLPYVPRNTLFVQALYTLPLKKESNSFIIFDVNLRATGKIFWNEENSRQQDFYPLLGASATFGYKDLELKLWGRNLTDTRFYTFYFMSMGNEFLQRGKGVEFGLSLRWNMKI